MQQDILLFAVAKKLRRTSNNWRLTRFVIYLFLLVVFETIIVNLLKNFGNCKNQ